MTHIITHSSKPISNHVAWEQIRIYTKYLQLQGVNASIVSPYRLSVTPEDTLTIFCCGQLIDRVALASHTVKQLTIVVNDLSWPIPFHTSGGLALKQINHLITPFHGTNMVKYLTHTSILNECDKSLLADSDNWFIPFGALTALQHVADTLECTDDKLRDFSESGVTYAGSLKLNRIRAIHNLASVFPSVSLIGRKLTAQTLSLSDKTNVTYYGWQPPRMVRYMYQHSANVALVTDPVMTPLGFDYDRPYDIALSQAKLYATGPCVTQYRDEFTSNSVSYMLDRASKLTQQLSQSRFIETIYA